ncbi:MAG: hypothetical protein ACFE9I_18655 [Candidatus Hermodarchaeota archaeon]
MFYFKYPYPLHKISAALGPIIFAAVLKTYDIIGKLWMGINSSWNYNGDWNNYYIFCRCE